MRAERQLHDRHLLSSDGSPVWENRAAVVMNLPSLIKYEPSVLPAAFCSSIPLHRTQRGPSENIEILSFHQ